MVYAQHIALSFCIFSSEELNFKIIKKLGITNFTLHIHLFYDFQSTRAINSSMIPGKFPPFC